MARRALVAAAGTRPPTRTVSVDGATFELDGVEVKDNTHFNVAIVGEGRAMKARTSPQGSA